MEIYLYCSGVLLFRRNDVSRLSLSLGRGTGAALTGGGWAIISGLASLTGCLHRRLLTLLTLIEEGKEPAMHPLTAVAPFAG